MEADKDQLKTAKRLCADPGAGSNAPRVVIEGLLTLTNGQAVRAAHAARRENDGETTWRALWLTDNHLAYVEASKRETDWDLTSHHQEHDTVSGWVRPLTDVSGVAVDEISDPGREFGTRWSWSVSSAIELRSGDRVQLPLFGGMPSSYAEGAVDAFREALLARLGQPQD